MKKAWILFAVMVTVFFVMPLTAHAETFVSGDYEYTLNENNEATITAYNGSATELKIPEKLDEYTVVQIGKWAFNKVLPNLKIGFGTRHCLQK